MTTRLLRMTAKELAGAHHDGDRREVFRKAWPNQRTYVEYNWPYFLGAAREALAAMLTSKTTHEHLKQPIYDDLLEDNERRQRMLARRRPHVQVQG